MDSHDKTLGEAEFSTQVRLFVLGLLESWQLPGIATRALTQGLDSPSLRLLSSISNPVWDDCAPLFEKAVNELMMPVPTDIEAAFGLALQYAQNIVSGKVLPHVGAKKIWDELSGIDAVVPSITVFEELSWAYLSNGGPRPFSDLSKPEISKRIIFEARRLLNTHQCSQLRPSNDDED